MLQPGHAGHDEHEAHAGDRRSFNFLLASNRSEVRDEVITAACRSLPTNGIPGRLVRLDRYDTH
jgi:hypothetical protein